MDNLDKNLEDGEIADTRASGSRNAESLEVWF